MKDNLKSKDRLLAELKEARRRILFLQQAESERNHTRAVLKKSEETFTRIFQSSPTAMVITDLDNGKCLAINNSFAIITGYNHNDAYGRSLSELGFWPSAEDSDQFPTPGADEGGRRDIEYSYHTKYGDKRLGWFSFELIDIYGKPCLITSIKDITVLKQTEKALIDSEARSRALLNAIPDMMFQISKDGVFTGFKGAREELYVPPEMFLQKRLNEVLPPDLAALTIEYLEKAMNTDRIQVYEYSMVIDGEKKYYESRMVKSTEEGVLAIVRDITERKHSIEAVRKSSEKIKMFAYSVSHDLKNPAISIHGLAKRLNQYYSVELGEKGGMYCELILKASEEIALLVETINAYITAKEAPLKIETVNLQAVVDMLADEFRNRLKVRGVTMAARDPLPEIRADKLSVMRVLRNLVDNALKYGGERLTTIQPGYRDDGDHHVISIMDDGIGIKIEDSEKVFYPFKRKSGARGLEGAGLGLAIVKELAEKHMGAAWAEPGEDGGTVISFSISKSL